MKNQINKLTQGIFEVFKGPRTKDYEYDKMVQEYQICKDQLLNLKSLIDNYPQKLEGYKTTIEELILSFENIFGKDKGMYSKFMTDATNAHKALHDKLTNMFMRIEQLKEIMNKWTEHCTTVDEKMKLREEKRKTFDHYDEKMGDLYEDRQKIFAKGNTPDEKDEEKYMRNIKKYQDAAKEYADATNDAYKHICYFIDSKYQNVSIGVAEFLEIELIFYSEVSSIFNYFRNIRKNVLTITFKPPKREYEASDFIRGKALLNLNIEDVIKNKTNISGVIEGKPEYSHKSTINNDLNRNNPYPSQSSVMNNTNNINNNNNQTFLLNPYNNYNNNQPLSSYNYYKSNIDNSAPDPFGNNNKDEFSNNPFVNKNDQPPERKNPYDSRIGFSGDNPFDKPNI